MKCIFTRKMRKVLSLKPYTRPLTCQALYAVRCLPLMSYQFDALNSLLHAIPACIAFYGWTMPPPPHSHPLPLTMKYLITGSTQKFKPFTLLDVCIMCKMHSFHLTPRFFSQRGGVKGSVQRDCLLPAFCIEAFFRFELFATIRPEESKPSR
jgi:hypothetical protein